MAGMAFGTLVHSLFGPAVGPPALYAVIAMGGVFAAAAQAPLTAIASVAEMTGNFGITLPIMLTCGISAAVSKYLSYGSVYTTKLLRRGIDIERPKTTNVLQTMTVAEAMQPVPPPAAAARLNGTQHAASDHAVPREQWERLAGAVTDTRQPQELFRDETLEQALRQLTLYGASGLPVLSNNREHVQGWITRHDILDALAQTVRSSDRSIDRGALAADFATDDPALAARRSSTPLTGYQIVEITIDTTSPALGRQVNDITWPPGCLVVAVTDREMRSSSSADPVLLDGERIVLLAPAAQDVLPTN
jgi:CIC family chloride channel protein